MTELVGRLFVPSYGAVHTALYRQAGPARKHPCAACGQPAEHWAVQHRRDGVRLILDGPRPYSNRREDYAPLCVPCHKRYDAQLYCHRGRGPHLMIGDNVVIDGGRPRCRACRNLAQNARRRRTHA